MSGGFDRLLRDAVHDLATGGQPVDLARPALKAARRIRTRRAVSAVASALVLVAGLAVVVNRVVDQDNSLPPADDVIITNPSASPSSVTPTTEPGSAPVVLPGGWMIRRAPGPQGGIVYDDARSRYVTATDGAMVLPSPNGRFRAIVEQTGLTITETSGGRTVGRGTGGPGNAFPVWSPDSSKLAYILYDPTGYHLNTVAIDGARTSSDPVQCANRCTIKWVDGQLVRVHGTAPVEVTVATGDVRPAPTNPTDPCGAQFAAHRIDTGSWLCLTGTGFAVKATSGAVTTNHPFPTALDGIPVGTSTEGYILFQLK